MQVQNKNPDLSHLFLNGWPFQRVSENFASVWADRSVVKGNVDRLIWRWSRRDESYINIMWADVGAGKSHTLMYIRQHCLKHTELGIIPIYVVTPKEIRSFLDVYQTIMEGLNMKFFADLFDQVDRSASGKDLLNNEVFQFMPDALTVIPKLQSGSDAIRNLSFAWLKGTRGLTRGQLNMLEVNGSIKTTDHCVAVLHGLVKLIQITGKYRRILIMLDECQRIWDFQRSIGANISTGLQTWYDSCPKHFSLFLSFKSGYAASVKDLLSEDLRSRADFQSISLPLLGEIEAIEFISYLLNSFRIAGSPSPRFPFSDQIFKAVIRHLTQKNGVSPRTLMKAFDALLTEADFCMETGGQFAIDTKKAIEIVEEALRNIQDED